MHLVFDISLTVAKPWLHQPSGIDRVEFAHTRHWRSLPEHDITFVMRTAWDSLAAIPHDVARQILAEADQHIAPGMQGRRIMLRARSGLIMTRHFFREGRALLHKRIAARADSVLLSVSCATLHKHASIAALRGLGCRFMPLIHDTIPLTHPQYFPADEAPRHALRMEAVANMAEGGLVVSAAARDDLGAYFREHDLTLPPMTVAHPGLDLPRFAKPGPAGPAAGDRPYLVILGSLEPRKNHLLMLQIWQSLRGHPDAPRLIIIGRRPYEAHTATMTLDRADFGGMVQDLGRLPDGETARLLSGARALLFPSIAEGFGIPLAEALALGVPVIASDIPAFREVGGSVPDYLDPLDGLGWRQAVLDYAAPDSLRRAAQLARLPGWTPPSWDRHFQAAERGLEATLRAPHRAAAA